MTCIQQVEQHEKTMRLGTPTKYDLLLLVFQLYLFSNCVHVSNEGIIQRKIKYFLFDGGGHFFFFFAINE